VSSRFCTRRKENTTSEAVSGSPLENLTPLRSVKVNVLSLLVAV